MSVKQTVLPTKILSMSSDTPPEESDTELAIIEFEKFNLSQQSRYYYRPFTYFYFHLKLTGKLRFRLIYGEGSRRLFWLER